MRNLVINRKNLKALNRNIGKYVANIGVVNEEGNIPVEVVCEKMHNLPTQGTILLVPDDSPFIKEYEYEIVDAFKFIVYFPEFVTLHVNNYGSMGGNAVLEAVDDDFREYVADSKNITLRYMNEILVGSVGIEYDENGVPTNEEDAAARIVTCDKPVYFRDGHVDVKTDWFLKDGVFNTGITFEEKYYAIELDIPLERDAEYRLADTQKTLDDYVESLTNAILPEVIDNEKKRFIPIYYDENGKPKLVKEISFNLHFRDRKENGVIRDGWKTTNDQLWNGMSLKNGRLIYDVKGMDDTYGDTLDYLGFDENDVKFSKNKVRKSFIRITYFSLKNMLLKEALSYATVFMDAGEIYGVYNKISGNDLPIFDNNRLDKSLRISSTFKLYNNRQNKKSSEGFYLYFYPNIIDSENPQKTIYMKIEFNHAGVGKTVPLMLPRNIDGKILKSGNADFPLNFTPEVYDSNGNVGRDFDFNGYQNAVLIPIEVGYNEELGEYVYVFPFATPKNGCIELNLFEPKVNGTV